MVILASEMTFIRKESFLNVKIQRQIIHDKNALKFSDNTETQELDVNSNSSTLPIKTEIPIRQKCKKYGKIVNLEEV